MAEFEFPASIRSRPTYGRLQLAQGAHHFFIADDEGGAAICEILENNPDAIANSSIVFINTAKLDALENRITALGVRKTRIAPSFESTQPHIRHVLAASHMGMQLYIAGTEGCIGLVMREAMEAGINHDAIQTEHRGSIARRMQCVHCKGITNNVTHTPFQCAHCGLHLFVRDHYSRRYAAFQGVCVDAEDPGNIPPKESIYP